jgi:hypothetical protein
VPFPATPAAGAATPERVDHFIETYYRASAEVFHMAHGEGMSTDYAEAKAAEALQALSRVGFPARHDDAAIAKIVELEKRMEEVGEKSEWTDKVAELEDFDFFVKQSAAHHVQLFRMSDEQFNEYLKLVREHRKRVRSLMEPVPVAVAGRKG